MSPAAPKPDHTISSRPPTEDERKDMAGRAGFDLGSYGCLLLFGGLGPAFVVGLFAGWVIGCIAGAGLLLVWLVWFIPYERRQRRRAALDAKDQIVQEITVRDPRVVEIDPDTDNEPVLVFDIGRGKSLFLQGQWLRDPSTYGAPEHEGDPEEEFLNGLAAPWSFPSTSFIVTRLPHSGRVLGIQVMGEYRQPEKEIHGAWNREYEFGDSELFDGELDRIADVLAREHAARFPTKAGTGA